MSDFAARLDAELDAVPVIDPHTHLRPSRPQADNLADVVLYHHVWSELVSSGMPATAVTRAGLPHELADPGMPPMERLGAALPYLGNIRNTTCGCMLGVLLEDIYGVEGGVLTEANLEATFARAADCAASPDWRSQLTGAKCHIRHSLTVEGPNEQPIDDSIGKGFDAVPVNLVSGKLGTAATLTEIERQFGTEIRRADDYATAINRLGQDCSRSGVHFAGVWTLPYLSGEGATDDQIDRTLEAAGANAQLSPSQLGQFTSFGLRHFLEGMRNGPLRTIQLIVGAEVLPPHRSLTHWHPAFAGGLGRVAAEFEDFHFNCSTASDLNIQDLAILAKHVPNISVLGYWWHLLYPAYIRKSIETRLDIVPANKIVAFFSDAYHAEWCYPKLKLVKQIFGQVLFERVERGWYTPDVALSLVRQTFYDNPRRIYGITTSREDRGEDRVNS